MLYSSVLPLVLYMGIACIKTTNFKLSDDYTFLITYGMATMFGVFKIKLAASLITVLLLRELECKSL